MLQCVIKQNHGYEAMDRVYLELWLISRGVEYKLGRFGDWLCWLTPEQIGILQDEGWPVRIL